MVLLEINSKGELMNNVIVDIGIEGTSLRKRFILQKHELRNHLDMSLLALNINKAVHDIVEQLKEKTEA